MRKAITIDDKKHNIKIRETWTVNPVTRVKGSKKAYNRNKAKKETREEVQEYGFVGQFDFGRTFG